VSQKYGVQATKRLEARDCYTRLPRAPSGCGGVDYGPKGLPEVSPRCVRSPFTIEVPDEVLDHLRSQLARTRWPDPLPYPGWMAGADIGYLKALVV